MMVLSSDPGEISEVHVCRTSRKPHDIFPTLYLILIRILSYTPCPLLNPFEVIKPCCPLLAPNLICPVLGVDLGRLRVGRADAESLQEVISCPAQGKFPALYRDECSHMSIAMCNFQKAQTLPANSLAHSAQIQMRVHSAG